jgi:hypothetical protein
VRDLLRIDVYVVSDEGEVEVLIGDPPEPEMKATTPNPQKRRMALESKTDAERAQYLLDHQTISDRSWTNEPRLKDEKRDAFIRRVLLGQLSHGQAVKPEEAGTVEDTEPGADREIS